MLRVVCIRRMAIALVAVAAGLGFCASPAVAATLIEGFPELGNPQCRIVLGRVVEVARTPRKVMPTTAPAIPGAIAEDVRYSIEVIAEWKERIPAKARLSIEGSESRDENGIGGMGAHRPGELMVVVVDVVPGKQVLRLRPALLPIGFDAPRVIAQDEVGMVRDGMAAMRSAAMIAEGPTLRSRAESLQKCGDYCRWAVGLALLSLNLEELDVTRNREPSNYDHKHEGIPPLRAIWIDRMMERAQPRAMAPDKPTRMRWLDEYTWTRYTEKVDSFPRAQAPRKPGPATRPASSQH